MSRSIAFGSKNEHKVAALREAIARLERSADSQDHLVVERSETPQLEIVPYASQSGIGEQPIGPDAQALGAEMRARRALTEAGLGVDFGMGIESGIEFRGGRTVDIATIVIVQRVRDGESFEPKVVQIALTTTVGVMFPRKYLDEALAVGLNLHTAGEFIAKALGGDRTDPHSTLTRGRITRQQLLVDAIYAALVQVW